MSSNKLLVQSSQSLSKISFCDYCCCKSQYFGMSNKKYQCPLDLLYNNVWGPLPLCSMDGYS